MSDLIERQAAIKAVERLPNCYNGFSDTYDKACIIGVLEEVPSAQPQRMRGKWIDDCSCSNCHWIHENDKGLALLTNYRFCPNCGARMDGGEQDD